MAPTGKDQRILYSYDHSHTTASAAKDPSWSPDGGSIAFAAENLGDDEVDYWAQHIYVIDADGSNMRRITQGQVWDSYPSWSPDGQRIAYRSNRDGNTEIYVMNADGSGSARLIDNADGVPSSPAWAPDGAAIAYVTGNGALKLIGLDGSNERTIVAERVNASQPSWSHDSSRIAYSRDDGECSSIAVVNADGTGETTLPTLPGHNSEPAWSPHGDLIAFANSPIRGWQQLLIVSAAAGQPGGIQGDCPQLASYEPNPDLLPDQSGGLHSASSSMGKVRVAVLFLDFPDAIAPYSTHREIENINHTQSGAYSIYRSPKPIWRDRVTENWMWNLCLCTNGCEAGTASPRSCLIQKTESISPGPCLTALA